MSAAVAILFGAAFVLLYSGLVRPPRNHFDNYLPIQKPRRIAPLNLAKLQKFRPTRRSAQSLAISDEIWFLGLQIEAGQSLFASLKSLSECSSGTLAKLMLPAVANLQLGSTFEAEFAELERHRLPIEVVELLVQLRIAIDRGTPISQTIFEQSRSSAAATRAQLITAAGKNETKTLIPIVFLVLPVTVIFAIFPSLLMVQGIF